MAFLEQFIDLMTATRDRPVYKLLHVGVPHRPIVVDRECRFIGGTAMSRQSYTEQSRCAIRLVAALLDRARALGIYDSSLIIVSSDHGTDLQPAGFNGRSNSLSLIPGPSTVRLPAIASTAKAVMLIKPPNRTGPITVSEAPTSHVDLPATILDILGLPGGSPDGLMFAPRSPSTPHSGVSACTAPPPNGAFRRAFRPARRADDRRPRARRGGVECPAADMAARSPARQYGTSTSVRVPATITSGRAGPSSGVKRAGDSRAITFVQALTTRAIISASLPPAAVRSLYCVRLPLRTTGRDRSVSMLMAGPPGNRTSRVR